jgi:hypothetical protein
MMIHIAGICGFFMVLYFIMFAYNGIASQSYEGDKFDYYHERAMYCEKIAKMWGIAFICAFAV